ncbi:MAG: ArgE/DapE family deacylase [Armatimonadetes bacterium]|nr:ArgE/DapE family deacylase [Armatimonadota bacterium]
MSSTISTEYEIGEYLETQRDHAARLLYEMISQRSTVGQEQSVQQYVYDQILQLGLPVRYVPIDEDMADDPDHTHVPGHVSYKDRPNLVVDMPHSGVGRSLILNAHADVVPGQEEVFSPRYEDGIVYGRGACDDKGSVVTMLLVLETIKSLGIELNGRLQAQFVIEEETGGNGSLSLIRQGNRADAAVVLEPTNLKVCPANRGALWYKLSVAGKSVHMGKYYEGVSAIERMVELIGILQDYEKKLVEESRGNPLFPDDPSPVKVNIGQIQGGDWPSTVPGECFIEGSIGFLPNKRLRQIEQEVREAIESRASEWTRRNYNFECARLHNDAFETPLNHPAVKSLCSAADSVRGAEPPEGWIVSCDARLFYQRGRMPTIVFGPGDLSHAHSLQEQVKVSDILTAAEVLTRFVMDWCGSAATTEIV